MVWCGVLCSLQGKHEEVKVNQCKIDKVQVNCTELTQQKSLVASFTTMSRTEFVVAGRLESQG